MHQRLQSCFGTHFLNIPRMSRHSATQSANAPDCQPSPDAPPKSLFLGVQRHGGVHWAYPALTWGRYTEEPALHAHELPWALHPCLPHAAPLEVYSRPSQHPQGFRASSCGSSSRYWSATQLCYPKQLSSPGFLPGPSQALSLSPRTPWTLQSDGGAAGW